MTPTPDYATATARELAQALRDTRVSAVELFDTAVARIERMDGQINAVVCRDFERARGHAQAADQALAAGERLPLLGVPMTVKESFNVRGLPTTWGVPGFEQAIAARDAVTVSRLRDAGAIVLGKTNVPPSLSDWQSANRIYGRTNNPHDLTRTPGGSSGGSAAALAAGMVPLELGSDIGGSIRVPAHFCGVYGHKPSHDLVPQRGHGPGGLEGPGVTMAVCGPMARSAADLELALDVLAGPDEMEAVGYRLALPPARHTRLSDFRVLIVDKHPAVATDSEIVAALNGLAAELEKAGAKVGRADPDLPDLGWAMQPYGTLLNAIVSRAPGATAPSSSHDWLNAIDMQYMIRTAWRRVFERWDVVLAPVFGVAAFRHEHEVPFEQRTLTVDGVQTPYGAQLAWPSVALLANLPATAFPVGKTREGLPIGLQVIGPFLEDYTPIAFARLVQEARAEPVRALELA